MEKSAPASLFQVYLRLRPPPSPLVQLTPQSLYPTLPDPERFLTIEPAEADNGDPTHITIRPPSDSRKRAVEKFGFTKVFDEQAEQLDIFKGTGVIPLVEGVLGGGRDGLVATLGVTGSGKSHTILGSKTQRGITQLSLDLLYRSIDSKILHPEDRPSLIGSLAATDASEALILSAGMFLDMVYGDGSASRAGTPMMVGHPSSWKTLVPHMRGPKSQWSILGLDDSSSQPFSPKTIRVIPESPYVPSIALKTRSQGRKSNKFQENWQPTSAPKRRLPHHPSALPKFPDISADRIPVEANSEFAILVSMFEVYNDRIFDLLAITHNHKDLRRRALLFKPTEASPDRKVVAGLRKIVCGSYDEAMMVLETGLIERRVAGTGSNSVSSRSHGFFCVEVKKRPRGGMANSWNGANLTVVDLAGSERARNAKTAGATLAEAGKINESLMYLGQCLQMQSDVQDSTKPTLVPFRQCKLTELLFSNSFPTNTTYHHYSTTPARPRNPQKATMIVTADPLGDFNATSQILRYSALAREVTVPRIPSVSSTILAGIPGSRNVSGRSSPPDPNASTVDEGVVELAFSELARLNEEVELLSLRLGEEENRRREAEEGWARAEEKAESIELEVRDEVWREMESKMEAEKARWRSVWEEEGARGEERFDKKLEILSKGIQIREDEDVREDTQGLERENAVLRARLQELEREVQSRSPSKKQRSPRKKTAASTSGEGRSVLGETTMAMNGMSLSPPPKLSLGLDFEAVGKQTEKENPVVATPGKKFRKLTGRKLDLMDVEDLEAYEAGY